MRAARSGVGSTQVLASLAGLTLLAYGGWGAVGAAYFLLPGAGVPLWVGSCTIGCVCMALAWFVSRRPSPEWFAGNAPVHGVHLTFAICIGVLLRVSLAAAYPAPQWSDARTYLEIARTVLETGTYRLDGDFPWSNTVAYWPPGTVFWLLPWLANVGTGRWTLVLGNLVLATGSMIMLWRLVAARWGRSCALAVVALFAIWPNHAFHALFVSKEYLAQFLLLAATWLQFGERDGAADESRPIRSLLAGACCGAAMLTQPSTIMVPAILAVALVLGGVPVRAVLARTVVVFAGVALIVAPWSLRNYLVLDHFVLINTANGISLLEAAQPGAAGDWAEIPKGVLEDSLGEVERSRIARSLAIAWIIENPSEWLRAAVVRQLWFLGQSHRGAFLAMANEMVIGGGHYATWKFASDFFMLIVWFAVAACGARALRSPSAAPPFMLFCVGVLVYFLAMHSVFGSGGRHQPIPGAYALMLAGMGVVRSRLP